MSDTSDSKFLTVFDVETADAHHTRICQIGVVRMATNEFDQGFHVVDTHSCLINPEIKFGEYNTKTHGISADDVKDAPTFKEAWDDWMHKYFTSDTMVVGHNVKFDLAAMDKCCAGYNIKMPSFTMADTMQMCKDGLPYLPNHKLDTVSAALGVSLDSHHDALSDARATADSFARMAGMHIPIKWNNWEPKHAEKQLGEYREKVSQISIDDFGVDYEPYYD